MQGIKNRPKGFKPQPMTDAMKRRLIIRDTSECTASASTAFGNGNCGIESRLLSALCLHSVTLTETFFAHSSFLHKQPFKFICASRPDIESRDLVLNCP